jgi:asparagine synthase (glutamine-hydrolysing)
MIRNHKSIIVIMCGFFGIVGDVEGFDIDSIERSAEMIRHRGPDEFNLKFFDNAAIASARLKVVGSTAGVQPINLNQSDCLVYNGEIFNFNFLQIKYSQIPLSSRSDTENLYHFLNYGCGNDCGELEGQFAFANWNVSTGELILVRDRNGEKPLYYRAAKDYLVFSSSADAIINLLDIPKIIDKDSIANYLSNGWLDSNKAFFAGIDQLRPGVKLIWSEKKIRLETFKRSPIQLPKNNESLESKVAELEEIFSDVINRQLDADIDVGIFLSGGIDSSLIASFAAEKSKFLNAFSIELPNQNDDVSRSKAIAKSLGIEHHVSVFDEAEFNKSLDIYVNKFDTPISDSGVLSLISLVQNAKKYSSVALAGEGGDELFAGYPWAYSSFVQTRFGEKFPFFENLALRVKRRLTNSVEEEERCSNKMKANLNSSLNPIEVFQRFVSKDFVLDEKEISNMGLELTSQKFPSETPFGLQEALSWDRQHYLVNDLLVKADRSSMALGFELRLPFLSDAMIEFAGNLPPKFLISHEETKIILRRLAEARMPDISWRGQKYGLGVSNKNIADYLDLDSELQMLLSSKNIMDAFSKAEITQINEYFFKNFKSKWMAFMLLKWMGVRV